MRILDDEMGDAGKYLLKRQCKQIGIQFDSIEHEDLPVVSLKLYEVMLFFGRDRANNVYERVRHLEKAYA